MRAAKALQHLVVGTALKHSRTRASQHVDACSENTVNQSAPKERRGGRAEKRLSKRVFLESPFLLCSLKVFRTFQVF